MHRFVRILFFLLFFPYLSFAQMSAPRHDLRVSFDPGRSLLSGVSTITVSDRKDVVISLAGLSVGSVTLNGLALAVDPSKPEIPLKSFHAGNTVRIEYTVSAGRSSGADPAAGDDRSGNPGVVSSNVIGPDGIVLTGGWHPAINGPAIYSLTATVPAGFEGISEADEIRVKDNADGSREFSFVFPHPVGSINFAAGRYSIVREKYNGIDIYGYFLPEDAGQAGTYIEYTKKYLGLYEGLLVKYPYKRFSIVENVLPTGYAMPTFTLLGRDVIRLPFIVETSLGHEILHQWFGNGVYVDYSRGNWSEGLVTYLADHLYEENKGTGSSYRKKMLTSFQSAVNPENDFPLASFSGRSDRASAAVGYSKAGMVFHMLKELVGDGPFGKAIRDFASRNMFKPASWADIRVSFEEAARMDLSWFFDQWLDRKGAPDLALHNAVLSYRGSKAVISFDLSQKGEAFRLLLPVAIKTDEGEISRKVSIDKQVNRIELEIDGSPVSITVDGQYDSFRKLAGDEYPPVLYRLINDSGRTAVFPEGKEREYAAAMEALKKEGFALKSGPEVTYETIRDSSLLIIGSASPLAARLLGRPEKVEGDLSVVTLDNPFSERNVIAVIDSNTPGEIVRYLPRIMHYGSFSTVAFRDGRNVLKQVGQKKDGMQAVLAPVVSGIELPRMVGLPAVIEKVRGSRIVYVGEVHDRFEHHRAQFEVVRGLHKKNGRIAIGMEMFQQPYQKFLDEYVAGTIDEKEFLKKSEYFKRWNFDYNLYREILLYARENRIPVVALNIRKEIVSKVSKEGIHALTKEEQNELPAEMDLSDSVYRARLKEVFQRHKGNPDRNFDFFFQSQVLWDESMAHALDAFIRKNPGHQVVVIAGSGHMSYGSGIPRRAYRLNGLDYSIIMNGDEPYEGIADYVLVSQPVAYREAPRLMIQFSEGGKGLKIAAFAPESISEKAGLKKDDVIVSLDGVAVEDLEDVKIHLLYKKKGDTVTVKALRNRFLLGDKEMTFTLKL